MAYCYELEGVNWDIVIAEWQKYRKKNKCNLYFKSIHSKALTSCDADTEEVAQIITQCRAKADTVSPEEDIITEYLLDADENFTNRIQKFKQRLVEAKSAVIKAGSHEAAGGATGAKFILDSQGKKIGIFKEAGKNGRFKELFGQASILPLHDKLFQPHGELATAPPPDMGQTAYQVERPAGWPNFS